jgi:predicted metal-dependent phosphoesterase TrpH
MGEADLHIHSTYSFDGTASVREVLQSAARAGLDLIAITDHNDVRGGLEARDLAGKFGLQAIPGAEISTREGHLLALFIEQVIPAGLSLVETLLRVGEQEGIGIAPHPDHPVPNSLPAGAIRAALEHPLAGSILRGIEVCNLNPAHSLFNKRSEKAATSLPLARIASSDAHLADMVGAGMTHFDGHTPADLRLAIEARSTLPEQVKRESALRVFLRWARLYHRRGKSRSKPDQRWDRLSGGRLLKDEQERS